MKNLIWTTVQRRVHDLVPQDINPRRITDKQLSDLKQSLEKFNLVEIPAIDIDGTILAGHQRIKVLKLLGRGEETIDVRIPNRKLTDEEAKQYLIGSNALGGDWDFDLLKDFDLDLLIDVGFDQVDLANIWDNDKPIEEKDFDFGKEVKNIKEPQIKLGDIIEIGNHRLICGDATDPKVLKKLCGNEKVSMIYSDPPYNIDLDYNKGIGGEQNYGGNVKDDRSYLEYRQFIKDTMTVALSVTNTNSHVFYWCDQTYIGLMQDIYRELGVINKRVCLWIKNGHNPTPGVAFNKCYEPCVYGVKGKPYIAENITALNEVMNNDASNGNALHEEIGDIWLEKRLSGKEYEHATSKPSELHHKAIKRCTKPGDIILDSFGGSGSTLIAGEQLKRKVYMIELEPVFCDVIINRYEKLTGKKAVVKRYEEN